MNSTLTAGTPQGTAQASPSAASGQSEEKLPAGVISVNTASFALAFAAWVMFGPSVRFIAKELGLSVPVATLIKTLPVLVGSVMRIPLGILTDVWEVTLAAGTSAANAIHAARASTGVREAFFNYQLRITQAPNDPRCTRSLGQPQLRLISS